MIKILSKAKRISADRLVSVTGIKEEPFLLYYHFSKNNQLKMKELKIEVPKGESVESLISLYANAEILEAETAEMFGITFEGNPSSGKRLFREEKKCTGQCFQ
ncbi:NADH-quinone oxidoreductase subunit C [Candidatus Micrarchaeota archaeon]|nr:NADH-quinone oxidoreductase subunit C [Candidatus Micrarchaeota archaeon]